MIYPGYQLNPGDMFQVEPDRVLYATGAPKELMGHKPAEDIEASTIVSDSDPTEESATPPSEEPSSSADEIESSKDSKEIITDLIHSAKAILATPSTNLTAKRKQDLRLFQRNLHRTLSRHSTLPDALDPQILELAFNHGIVPLPFTSSSTSSSSASQDKTSTFNPSKAASIALSRPDLSLLREALIAVRENPVDDSKPYATPWRPRAWMSAFAFVPRYLEVHHRICSAVYLRHPVARPGLGEVPTPYPMETNGLAFNWYLRRR